jgi:hypothetical protein
MSNTAEPMGHGEKRSRRGEAAIAALLTEPTIEAAAAKARISVRTLKYWLRQPRFQAAYRQARRDWRARSAAFRPRPARPSIRWWPSPGTARRTATACGPPWRCWTTPSAG